jgi:LysR family glycine cleavage system transcriptional activator
MSDAAESGVWTAHAFQARYRSDYLSRPQVRRFRDWLLAQSRLTEDWLWRQFGRAPSRGGVEAG